MSRKYTKIEQYKNQILSMKKEGKTQREIAERLGVEKEQIKEWFHRYRRKQSKIEAGLKIRPQGRPRKDSEPRDIVAEQAYEIRRVGGADRKLDKLCYQAKMLPIFPRAAAS